MIIYSILGERDTRTYLKAFHKKILKIFSFYIISLHLVTNDDFIKEIAFFPALLSMSQFHGLYYVKEKYIGGDIFKMLSK